MCKKPYIIRFVGLKYYIFEYPHGYLWNAHTLEGVEVGFTYWEEARTKDGATWLYDHVIDLHEELE